MRVIDRSALLPFTAYQVYELVNDVEAYPQYMDGCVAASVLRHEGDLMEAQLELARGGISQRFSTRNRLVAGESIALELIEGPFEIFNGRWDFRALGADACKVSLQLEFEVTTTLAGLALGPLFQQAANTMVDAFCKRAGEVYV